MSETTADKNTTEFVKLLKGAVTEIKKAQKGGDSKPKLDLQAAAALFLQQYPMLNIPGVGLHLYERGVYNHVPREYVLQKIGEQLDKNGQSKPSTRAAVLSELEIHEKSLIPQGVEPNQNRRVLNLKNGLYNIDSGVLNPHSPKVLSTIQLPVNFNPDAICDRCDKFLTEIQPESESRAILDELAGLCLIGDTRYEKSFWLHGSGGNGKGTYLNLLTAMLGEQNVASEELQTLSEPFHAIKLRHKLVNISTEVVSGDVTETTMYKKIISGDMISDSYKGQDRIDFRPFCLMLFSLNELPTVYDNSDAFFDRTQIIKFPINWRQDSRLELNLIDALRAELDGFFVRHALPGLRCLEAQRRFTQSPSVRLEVLNYRETNDKVLCFCNDNCEFGEGKFVARSEIFGNFKTYCKTNEFRQMSSKKFIHNLRRLYPQLDFSDVRETPENGGVCDRYIYGMGMV